MKKLCFLALGLASVLAASAQTSLVKDAERAMKNGTEGAKVVEMITPAFSDPATATLAQTWYVPGKAFFKEYDELLGIKAFKPDDPKADPVKMANLLLKGYDYFMKALPLDSVADSKGKIKTKYSKDIASTLSGHLTDYSSAGADLFNSKDYAGAYQAWGILNELAANPAFSKGANVPADTILGEIYFNQALAAWQGEKYADAYNAFVNAKNKGYNKKQLYDYAIAVALNIPDNEKVLEMAKAALPLYGAEDNNYMAQIVNYYLQAKDFDNAFSVINNAIAAEPNNAQYYVIQGVLYENQEKPAQAKESYLKAKNIDPKNPQALFNYGRLLCEDAYKVSDAAPTSIAEYDVYYKDKIAPLFNEAATLLEQAYTLDMEQNPDTPNRDILKYLENIYYNLKDEAKLNDVQNRMKY